jgi:bacteriophage N4 adsorption protein B
VAYFSAALVVAPGVFAAIWPCLLRILANLLLLSGIDDLVPLLICIVHWVRTVLRSGESASGKMPDRERRIAIFVPCWKESEVIANMIRHNLAVIRYCNYDFFLGVYPNDPATMGVVKSLSADYGNVHVSVCPHPGPTSKADCLNWIYSRMLDLEKVRGIEFDTVVLHDAEDLIHPEALNTINRERARHAMVQVPVLPLPTPMREWAHGVYCDEFAEFQTIDMPARGYCGSFIPSFQRGGNRVRPSYSTAAGPRTG